ncbi:unnamed protein product [Nesidiocoris tenuis]|uniref:Uncharacterized protein n=1 Tax=Nesidiocoris tenuis TaxID=355587 RepID=A0A6H5H0J0_9HEMI|nr:unnamed protein product [Nesidiocoris tenuis]
MFVVPAMQMEKEDSLTTSTAKSQPDDFRFWHHIQMDIIWLPIFCLSEQHVVTPDPQPSNNYLTIIQWNPDNSLHKFSWNVFKGEIGGGSHPQSPKTNRVKIGAEVGDEILADDFVSPPNRSFAVPTLKTDPLVLRSPWRTARRGAAQIYLLSPASQLRGRRARVRDISPSDVRLPSVRRASRLTPTRAQLRTRSLPAGVRTPADISNPRYSQTPVVNPPPSPRSSL